MSKSAKSVLIFGWYLVALGGALVAIPNVMLGMFGLPTTSEVWIRVVGVLVLCLAFYYIQAARHGLVPMLRWTVYARSSVILFFGAFVLLGFAAAPLVMFGAVDLAAALWTYWALRAEGLA
jgi:hypothetical protein